MHSVESEYSTAFSEGGREFPSMVASQKRLQAQPLILERQRLMILDLGANCKLRAVSRSLRVSQRDNVPMIDGFMSRL